MRKLVLAAILAALPVAGLMAQTLYWDDPRVLEDGRARFPDAKAGGGVAAVVWQEFFGNSVYLSLRATQDFQDWTVRRRFAGPFPFDGEEAPVFSLEVDSSGLIYVAVTSGDNDTTVLRSRDRGVSFDSLTVTAPETTLAPRLSLRADGSLYLFLVYDKEDSLAIYAGILDAESFSTARYAGVLSPVAVEQNLVFSFLPSHVSFRGRDYVVYQSKSEQSEDTPPYQLYLRISDPDGRFTQAPIRLTRYSERLGTIASARTADEYENQRPHIISLGDRLALAWERRLGTFGPNQIYYMELSADGQPMKEPQPDRGGEILPPYERVTENTFNCLFPRVFATEAAVAVTWFDNRRGENQIMIAERDRDGLLWREDEIWWRFDGDSIYGQPVQNDGQLAILWENTLDGDSRLVLGAPDQSVEPPTVVARGFTPGRPSRSGAAGFVWTAPFDSAGIAGFSYVWTQDPLEVPPSRLMLESVAARIDLDADSDGPWYFRITAKDFADNWSESTPVVFVRDTVAPGPVEFEELPTDANGFLPSNDVALSWKPADREQLAGYSYAILRIASDTQVVSPDEIAALSGGTQVRIQSPARSFANIDNGMWAVTVSAIDVAGNVGTPATRLFRTNRYVPVTVVVGVDKDEDQLGNVTLLISGRGFTEQGTIETVFLDRDGKEPYDYTYELADGGFQVLGDRSIKGPTLTRYEAGSYLLGLIHPSRGLYTTTPFITLDTFGTVKIGDFSTARVRPFWEGGESPSFVVSFNDVVIWFMVVFLGFIGVLAAGRLLAVAREGKAIRDDVFAVLTGDFSAAAKEQQMMDIKKRGLGLRGKFTLLIVALVLIVVLMLSIPLSYIMIQTETANLTGGLRQRATVLLGSMSGGASDFLLDQDTIALSNLTNQITSMPEAESATITSITARDSAAPGQGEEYIWATNDPTVRERGDYEAGTTLLVDDLKAETRELARMINERAIEEASGMVTEIEELRKQLIPLIGRTDAASLVKAEELGKRREDLEANVDSILGKVGSLVRSDPPFESQNPETSYLFYQPIVFRRPASDIYYRGLVRLRVSTETILLQIQQTRERLLIMISIIAVAALGLGTLGALLLASITINPIKRLAAHVAVIGSAAAIGQEADRLGGHRLEMKRKDEIRDLADTINEMNDGLVAAAIARRELVFGKGIQQKFIPLDPGATTGGMVNDDIEIYAYYKGADELSGDYFDYIPLDDEHYAVIKSDVSGHGITAALIMIEVATIFLSYFNNWDRARDGLKLADFLHLANDLIEGREFTGRFATIMVAIINLKTGVTVMADAGDNEVHLYDNAQSKMVLKNHPERPAAGVFDSEMVKLQTGGYLETVEKLNPGDTLFLMTDGIEEARRVLRDSDYNEVNLAEPEPIVIGEHEIKDALEEHFEELTTERSQAILNAVQQRRSYKLEKHYYPNPEDKFTFDFSTCDGTLEEAVLALMSVEKIFRIYSDPSAGPQDLVRVDSNVDAFLKKHFVEYSLYFSYRDEELSSENEVVFTHLRIDDQEDDLTVLAIRKK